MKFKHIELKQIRPYVRFTISTLNLVHSSYVVPLEHRIMYIDCGRADIWINNEHYKMEQNDVFYISSGTPYKVMAETGTSIYVMYFDLTMDNSNYHKRIEPIGISDQNNIPDYLTERYICKYKLTDKNNEIDFLYSKDKSKISLWLNEIKQYLNKDNSSVYCECIISGLMVSIISKMLNNSVYAKPSASCIVDSILAYIQSKYNENITLEDISSKLNFHKNYLNLCMKKETGLTIHKYLLNYRLSQAMDLIMYTNFSIAEVAEKVGFKDVKGFTVAFKNFYSIAPSKVKKQVILVERNGKNE